MNSLYSSDAPNNAKAELNAKGFNLSIDQATPVTKAEMPLNGGLVDSIVQKAAVSAEHEDRVLEELQKMDEKFSLDLPVAPNYEKNVSIAKFAFATTVILSVLVIGYFALNNSNQFFAALGVVPANEDTQEKQTVSNLRSQKIANNLIASAIILEKIALNTNKYAVIVNSDTAVLSLSRKNQLKKSLTSDLGLFASELGKASSEISSDPEAEAELVIFMTDQLAKVKAQAAEANSESLATELKRKQSLLEDAIKLMRAKGLPAKINSQNLSNLNDKQFLLILKEALAAIDKNALAKVAKVQIDRVAWTNVFNELENVLQKLDPTFDVFNPNENGKIVMNSYSFSNSTGTVNIGGQITTPTDDTFSVIANTVDALESSSLFKDIAYRSYNKAFQETQGYRASVNFIIKLETNV